MPLPDSLYYRKKELKKQYTSQPTGKLDVGRALDNNPSCWRKVELGATKLPKKIVINDTLVEPTQRDIRLYESYIQELVEQGFEVYLWQKQGPVLITKQNSGALHIPYYQSQMIQARPRDIIKTFEGSQISRDQIKMIDWKELISLHKALQAPDLNSAPPSMPEYGMLLGTTLFFKDSGSLSFSKFNEGASLTESIQAGIKNDQVSTRLFDSLTFNASKDTVPLGLADCYQASQAFTGIHELVFQGRICQFNEDEFEHIISDTMQGNLTFNSINTLTLKAFEFINQEAESTKEQENLIDSLFGWFLKEHIEHLHIESCENIDPLRVFDAFADSGNLKTCKLENGEFAGGPISLEGFISSPNLQYFSLDGAFKESPYFVAPQSDEEDLAPVSLEQLVELRLPEDTPIKGLEHLLDLSPNLKKLSCCLPACSAELARSLAGLEVLDLYVNNDQFALMIAVTLSEAQTSLKKVTLNATDDNTAEAMFLSFDNPKFFLPNLESFTCHATDVWDVLWLHGHEYTKLTELQFNTSKPLQALQELALHMKAPNLKSITFGSENPLPVDSDMCLDHLKAVFETYDIEHLNFNWFNKKLGETKSMKIERSELELMLAYPSLEKPNWYTVMINARIQSENSALGDRLGSLIGDELSDISPKIKSSGIPDNLGTSDDTANIDAKTQSDDDELAAVKIFKGINCSDPVVNHYRLSIFNHLEEKRIRVKPFKLSFTGELTYEEVTSFEYGAAAVKAKLQSSASDAEPCLLGAVDRTLSDRWMALPSLQSNDELLALSVSGIDRDDIEVRYHQQKKLYEIRKKSPGERQVHCEMVIRSPVQTPQKSAALEGLVAYFKEFTNEDLDLNLLPTKYSGLDLLDAIIDQKKGACRHRAIGFFKKAKIEYPDLKVNMVFNDVHAFVEVELDGQYCKLDLGGAPGNLKVHEPAALKPAKTATGAKELGASQRSSEAQIKALELDKRHTTWKQTKSESAKAVCLEAIAQVSKDSHTGQDYGHNVLIQCKDDRSADLIALQLQHDATHTNRPVFVIDSPDLVSCARKRMQRQQDGTGKPMEGGGPLYDFLTQDFQAGERPVLIINWNLLNPEDVVRLNSLIDEHRSADGTDIPREMVVVGVYNTKSPDAYKGSDFYSRNEVKYTIPVAHDLDSNLFELDVTELESQKTDLVSIELYDSDDWKDLLLGQWVIDEGKVVFKQGPLLDALEAGKGVHLANAPWDNPEFVRFWQQLKISGELNAYDRTYPIPDSFWSSMRQSKGYDWQAFNHIAFVGNASELENPLVFNGVTLSEFFHHTRVDESHPVQAHSRFADFAGKRVDLILTEELPWQLWHQLLTEASRYQVALTLAVPEGIEVPAQIKAHFDVKNLGAPLESAFQVIQSTDPDFTVELLKEDEDLFPGDDPKVIDISDFEVEDVFFNASFDINELTIQTKFSEVWELLNSGQDVILKGQFSSEVAQHLQTLALEQHLHVHGNKVPFKGKLILVSDQQLSPAIATQTKEPRLDDKLEWLIEDNEDDWEDELIEAIEEHAWPEWISLEAIKASIEYYQRSDPPSFHYLEPIEKEITIKLDPEFLQDEQQLQRRHAQCINQRYKDLRAILDTGPMAFIAGPTGVGKSTFIEKYLTPEMGYLVHHSLEQVKAWAQDKTEDKTKILFIDEANISAENYRMFEGLYEHPPYVVVDGKMIELDQEHEVIFAGNPLSYGGERNLPSFIARHGGICTFEPLPAATIQLEMIGPILSGTINELNLRSRASAAILKAYVEICQYSQSEVLVSPRELKMMAMMIAASDNPAAEYEAIVYKVASQALPKRYQARFASWANEHLPAHAHQSKVEPNSPADSTFILTDSRKPIYQTLGQMLNVRENLVLNPNSKVSAAGLGGMLLEGEPGTGKSHFYIDALRDYGYEQVSLDNMQTDKSKAFVFIPASMDFEQKAEKLVEAFEQGLIVVTDEINSGPALEQLLNSLLMGQHPDKTKDPSTIKPGFQLLGTQNPISMGHREATSGAIARRMMKFEFNAYTNDEMAEILKARFPLLTDKTIEKHVRLHVEHKQYAKAHDKEPIPVFRDLYKLMDNKQRAREVKLNAATKLNKENIPSYQNLLKDRKKMETQQEPTNKERIDIPRDKHRKRQGRA